MTEEKKEVLEVKVSKKLLAQLAEAYEMKEAGMKLIREGATLEAKTKIEVGALFKETDYKECAGISINKIGGTATLIPRGPSLHDLLGSLQRLGGLMDDELC